MPRTRLVYGYTLLVGLPLLCVFALLRAGNSPAANMQLHVGAAPAPTYPLASPPTLSLLFLQIVVVLAIARAGGWLARRIGQPCVVGEMAAGLILGPSMLGWLAPGISLAIFPPGGLNYLNVLSQVGLVLFMFVVGLSLNVSDLREYGHAAVLASHASIATPFCLGVATALLLYPRFSSPGVSFTQFALFMGAAMSITAFPVLARILAERNLLRTRIGALTVACAATDDVTGWCILAYILIVIRASGGSMPVWLTVAGAATYVVAMLFGVRRLASRFEMSYRRHGRLTDGATANLILMILLSALCTELLKIHLLFGAFLLGAVLPKHADFVEAVKVRFETLTTSLLVPLFFAFTGLQTNVRLLGGQGMWIFTGAVLLAAVGGKLGGCLAAGRLAGMPWSDAVTLGILMNTRGLMELVILNIGVSIGVIGPQVFSMMVIMALLTTFMTAPLLTRAYRTPILRAEVAAGQVA